ncbi:hypothetical protein PV327_005420 [Microctonus hyperodae]|uniref:Uncharacterized protein n=1 Tax=Microctonus hyperodae TaxID=165561 RepID=A0AA39G2R5_MICHY|nr:hypothetical protein PV327_005420 [Microctonus hyperodae]
MTTITDNDFKAMLNLYYHCNKQYRQILESMDDHYVRVTLGYANENWDERKKKDVLAQFQYIVDTRDQLRNDILHYFLKKLVAMPEGAEKVALLLEYNKFQAAKCGRPPAWTYTLLDTSESSDKKQTSNDRRPTKFTRIFNNLKTHLGSRKSLFN